VQRGKNWGRVNPGRLHPNGVKILIPSTKLDPLWNEEEKEYQNAVGKWKSEETMEENLCGMRNEEDVSGH